MYVCMYVFINVYMHVCMYIGMYVCDTVPVRNVVDVPGDPLGWFQH